ncbi:sialin isoform X1 [Patella vulgata]|uniref:sialin isoform X1 n=1 Tax=Patella vulgata TaxID=6465 RepID=UPI00217F457D|nr:sialin isoform X1 [Patella vulgata]
MVKGSLDLDTNYEQEEPFDRSKVPFWTSSRLGLAVLGFFGFVQLYALRVNMSVAIVCMVNHTAVKLMSEKTNQSSDSVEASCAARLANTTSDIADGDNDWDKNIQGWVLGAFFWGYLVSQIPAGWLATKIGGKRVLGWNMFAGAVLTLLTPVAANVSYIFLIVIRILLGLTSGVAFPAMHAMWGNWAPPLERSKLTSFTYAGTQLGNAVTFPLAGFLCKYGFAAGWPSIFYVIGTLGLIWFVLWMFLVSDTPGQHKRISAIERKYIEYSLRESKHQESKPAVPWKAIFTSLPVYAIVVSNTTSDWGAYTLLINIPTYMKEVLKFDIASNGLYSALPYIGFWFCINVSGFMADFVRKRNILSTTWTRRLFDAGGKVVPALLLIGLGYIDCTQPTVAIILLVLAVALTGPQYSGFTVNHVDLAPAFAGILYGFSNSVASVSGFLSPLVSGAITSKGQSRAEWQIVFYVAAGIYIFGAIFYILFASGELQDWAKVEDDSKNDIELKEPLKKNENDVDHA